MKILIVFTLLVCMAIPSYAASVPLYNVDALCNDIADISGGGNAMIATQCRREEIAAKKRVTDMHVPDSAMRACNASAPFGGKVTYILLEECLREKGATGKGLDR